MTLAEFAKSKNFPVHPCDGGWHRWDRGAKDNAYWKSLTYHLPDKTLVIVTFGDWKTGEKYQWRDYDPAALSPADLTLVKEADAKAEAAKRANQERVAGECQKKWDSLTDRGASAYLERKGLHGLYGCRLMAGKTYMPLRDVDGKLWSLQELHLDGLKILTEKGRKKGCFHTLGEIPPQGDVYVAEGLSTGASVFAATGKPVIVAIDAGNLKAVAEALRAKYPDLGLTFCADHDVSGRGLEEAEKARAAVGGQIRMPKEAGQDFNDLHVAAGLEEVKRQLEARDTESSCPGGGPAKSGPGAKTEDIPNVPPLPPAMSAKQIPQAPRQQRLVDHIVRHFDGQVIKQDKDLFLYVGTHWRLLKPFEHDRIKVLIQRVCQGLADVKHVDATFKLLCYHLPTPPPYVDLFAPHPYCVNFLNGTLHLNKDAKHQFTTDFRKHRREDYLVNRLPYNYKPPAELARNTEFESMLQRVFEGNPDIEEKIKAVSQAYGACLLPAFPHLFMFHGVPGTGKSTVINVAARLVHEDNLCSVPPNQWNGFNMEGMAGKLVNVDTDIPLNEPLNDEIVKKVIERKPFRIRRKGIKDIMAPIPAVHLFGGNDIPNTLDGISRAHARRWTFVEFTSFVPKGQYVKEYWDYCFEQGPEGVLRFALEGLDQLLRAGGHFFNPASGKASMEEWQLRTDPVGQFLEDIRAGEVVDSTTRIIWGEEASCERKKAWEIYASWFEEVFRRKASGGKFGFYKALRQKKIEEKRTKVGRYFVGFGVRVTEGAPH